MSVKVNRGGSPKGRRCTKTDHEVLLKIARIGFQSYPELRAGPLKDFSREHSWTCMKKLVEMGLLAEAKGDGGEIRGWFLAPKGGKLFENFATDEGWAVASRSPSYRTSYHHDRVLREIQSLLEVSPAIKKWVPEQKLRRDLMQRFFYLHAQDKSEKVAALPDALLHLRSGGQDSKAALELELRQKSRRRLFRKFEAHIIHSDFDFVFYIVEGESLLRTLWSVYKEVREKSVHVKFAKRQNGIFFAELSEVRKLGLQAKFKGVHDTFSLADLTA